MSDRTILVVDDDELILQSLTVVLSEWGAARDVAVLPATSAAEALAIVERDPGAIDLIVSDLNMPVMRGSDFLLAVKERFPEITTMIVSGGGDVAEMQKIMGAGIFAFLLKPCEPATLLTEVAKAVELSRLKRENRRYEQMIRDELRWAGEMQRAFLRPEPIQDAGLTVSVSYVPLPELQCGGDYYEVVSLAADQTLFLIGDVGGHGIRAALVTAMLKSIVSTGRTTAEPGRLMERVNGRICKDLVQLPDVIVTFFACVVDTSLLSLSCANAGHLPLFILRGQAALRVLPEGMGLGFSPDAVYPQSVVPLAHGDLVVMCTDGLLECLSASPSDAESRFTRILLACEGEPDFDAAVIAAAQREAGTPGFKDDAALISIRVR